MPYNDPDPKKDLARRAAYNALRRGELVRPLICSVCSIDGLIHAHHDDYNKPLKVKWLCPGCHVDRHNAINRAGLADVLMWEEIQRKATLVAKGLIKPLPYPDDSTPPTPINTQTPLSRVGEYARD